MKTFLIWKGIAPPYKGLEKIPCGVVRSQDKDGALEKIAQHRNGKVITIKDTIDTKHVQVGSTDYYIMNEHPNFLIL